MSPHNVQGKGKDLSQIGPDRISQPTFYLLYVICSDDKVKLDQPFLSWNRDFGRPWSIQQERFLVTDGFF